MSTGGIASLAGRTLFWPLAPQLECFPEQIPPAPDTLSARLLNGVAPLRCGSGASLRFAAPPPPAALPGYEERIWREGLIATRPGDWHDFFNALVWAAFPRSKAAINTRHLGASERTGGAGRRGPVRDALTQFDECGVVVAGADADLLADLARHRWHQVFWRERSRLLERVRFVVFGHASYDQLRAPFAGLCAKALYRVVPACWLALSRAHQLAEVDSWLAGLLSTVDLRPRMFAPLPLQGIPGVSPQSDAEACYRDEWQFRPLPAGRQPVEPWGAV
jgi:hypothetical protein